LTAITGACNANFVAATTEALTGLLAGETYFVQVWSNAVEQGTFNVRLSNPSLSNSDFDSSNFSFTPNPVRDILSFSSNKEINAIQIFNVIGQEVLTKRSVNSISQVDMTTLPNGVYMIRVTSDNQSRTIKVIKE
jgi:hypothetical protein